MQKQSTSACTVKTTRSVCATASTRRHFLRCMVPFMLGTPLALNALDACSTQRSDSAPRQPLRVLAQARNISLGTAAKAEPILHEASYQDVLGREFNLLTPELAMKFDAIHPQPDIYNFKDADSLIAFAQQHEMHVRGHVLVWHKALPFWVAVEHFNQDELKSILQEHISTLVGRYRREVKLWDVVNEALTDDGTLRETLWMHAIGPNYIEQAFRWAHEANPQARLFYNDYGIEGIDQKSDQLYALMKDLLKRQVPIHGIGMQAHLSLQQPPVLQDVLSNMRRFTALGLEVQITEMDVALANVPGSMQEKLVQQASIYRDMLTACLSVPNVTAFVMWGFTDRYYWIPNEIGADAPLVFDAHYQPKPAYFALADVLSK